ncbi:(2Fe-2S)-binding protein, partial [Streptomyces sp. SID5926]|nr:(2Fe-2S)-binding protein [Streptomyces sp. SID5926]
GQAEGREVLTVEGLAESARQRAEGGAATGTSGGASASLDAARRWQAGGTDSQTGENIELAPVQQAFIDAGAVQCGFCTPGLLVAADEMLERHPNPSDEDIREALSGNLCRCTGYEKIMDAVRLAAARRSEEA